MNDQRNRMNFSSAHPLHNTGNLGNSDVILALEVEDIFMLTHRMSPINRIGMDPPVELTRLWAPDRRPKSPIRPRTSSNHENPFNRSGYERGRCYFNSTHNFRGQ